MRNSVRFIAVVAGLWLAPVAGIAAQEANPPKKPRPDPIAAMEAKEKKFTEPGQAHKPLERFLGRWSTETRYFLMGGATTPEKGSAECSWLMQGRWMKCVWSGQSFAKPAETFSLIGYDNYRKNYVMTTVTSQGTAMAHAAGDLNADGSPLALFGTTDDYVGEEPDRMMKYLWRFAAADTIVSETYDLQLGGENGEKVVEVTYTRTK